MVKMEILFTILASVLACVFIVLRATIAHRNVYNGALTMLFKALASLGFLVVGLVGLLYAQDLKTVVFLVIGLLCGLVGDIILEQKTIYRNKDEEGVYLSGGMIAFLLGHVLFFVALFVGFGQGVVKGDILWILIAVSVVANTVLVLVSKKVLHYDYRKHLGLAIVYGLVLIFMTGLAISTAIVVKNEVSTRFAIAMGLFLLSDLILSHMYFGGRNSDTVLCVINHATYYAAQIVIASIIFIL